LKIDHQISDLNGIGIDSFNIALLYWQQGKIEQAISLAQEAERVFVQIGSPKVQQTRKLLDKLTNK
jgi:hypothetical protein